MSDDGARQPRAGEYLVMRCSLGLQDGVQPCPEAYRVGSCLDIDIEIPVWAVTIQSMQDLSSFVQRHGKIVVSPTAETLCETQDTEWQKWPWIEIYDTFRE